MELEQLTKAQTVLLTLLVSFVTSIATGIVTVTLMDQAPPAVTQTINRVVEKTIQTVVPAESQPASVTKEVVVVKEQNLVADVVEKNSEVLGRITKGTSDGEVFVGFGLFVNKKGVLITDGFSIDKNHEYFVYIENEKLGLSLLKNDETTGIAYLKTKEPEGGIFKPIFKEAVIVSPDELKLGESVVVLGGVESNEVVTGIVSGLVKDNLSLSTASSSAEETIQDNLLVLEIKTNIYPTSILSGAPLINLKGEVVGINLDPGSSSFIPIDFVKSDLEDIFGSELVANID